MNGDALRPPRAVYAGLFAVTLGTLMHEILLTRIFSVTMWYHFAFVAISVAMFGMTLGAVIVYLRPKTFPAEIAPRRLAQASLLYAVSIVVAFLVYAKIPFLGPNDAGGGKGGDQDEGDGAAAREGGTGHWASGNRAAGTWRRDFPA